MKKIFNFKIGGLLIFVIVLFVNFFFSVNYKIAILCVLASLLIYAKFNLAFMFNQGHGVLQSDKFKLRGFTIGKLVYFSIIIFIIVCLLVVAFTSRKLDFQTIHNLQCFSITISITIIISFLVWHYYWYDKTFCK